MFATAISGVLAVLSFVGGIAKGIGAYFGWKRDQALREDGARRTAEVLRGKTEEIKRVSEEIDRRPVPDSWRGVAGRLRKRNPGQP